MRKIIKCSKRTVQRWLNRRKQIKELNDAKRKGRFRITTHEDDQLIADLVRQDVDEEVTSKFKKNFNVEV